MKQPTQSCSVEQPITIAKISLHCILKHGDSSVNQLLAITHEIFYRFYDNYEEYSLTFRKLSLKCGTRELFINLNVTIFQ